MKQIESFEALVEFLQKWRAWSGEDQYDFGGMASLLGACLDSLREFALEAELEELAEYMEPEQVAFFKKLAAKLPEN